MLATIASPIVSYSIFINVDTKASSLPERKNRVSSTLCTVFSLSLEHPQGVGIVGTVGIVGIVGIEFCRPEPRPTTPSVWVDISSYSYLKEQKLSYT